MFGLRKGIYPTMVRPVRVPELAVEAGAWGHLQSSVGYGPTNKPDP